VTTTKNLGLVFDFLKEILADPESMPPSSHVVLIPADDQELARANIARGIKAVEAGKDVFFRHVGRKVTT
jgi:hypothetical protein